MRSSKTSLIGRISSSLRMDASEGKSGPGLAAWGSGGIRGTEGGHGPGAELEEALVSA